MSLVKVCVDVLPVFQSGCLVFWLLSHMSFLHIFFFYPLALVSIDESIDESVITIMIAK